MEKFLWIYQLKGAQEGDVERVLKTKHKHARQHYVKSVRFHYVLKTISKIKNLDMNLINDYSTLKRLTVTNNDSLFKDL